MVFSGSHVYPMITTMAQCMCRSTDKDCTKDVLVVRCVCAVLTYQQQDYILTVCRCLTFLSFRVLIYFCICCLIVITCGL